MEESARTILQTENLSIGYRLSKKKKLTLLSEINISMQKGELVCLLGPNGSGKSTFMRTLAGIQPPLQGATLVDQRPIKSRNFKEISQLLSIVLTERLTVENLQVFQVVSLGRYPYTNWLGKLDREDKEKIRWAMEQVNVLQFANHTIDQLSDGEKQRVMIAKALAQDTPLVMLDEPTAHLDLPNRVEIMKLLRRLAKETNKAILLSTHELDLALQAADTIWLMKKGEPIKPGVPEDLVLSGQFESTFNNQSFAFDKSSGKFKMNHCHISSIYVEGNSVMGFWTRQALEREGYEVSENQNHDLHIKINPEDHQWEVRYHQKHFKCQTIKDLLFTLRNNIST